MEKNLYPPGPKAKTPLRHLLALRRDIIGFLTTLAEEYGDIVYFKAGPIDVVLLNHPDYVKDVLVTHHRNFVKGRPLEMAKHLLGEGLLTSEGEFHSRQWRLVQPAFHHKRIEAYGAAMTEYASRLSARWQDGMTVDVAQEMMQMSTAIAGKTMFNAEVETEAAEIVAALTTASSLFARVSLPFAEWLLKLPLPSTFRFHRAKARLDATIYRMIDERRQSGKDYGDLLSMLLLAQDADGDNGRMTDQQVRDEALTLFLTAFDTTSLALTWTWYLLSQNPEAEAELHAELDQVLGERLPSVEDLAKLKYTRMVLTEAIRFYPPLYVIARQALSDYPVDQYVVPAGALILMSPYLLHRDARFYSAPDKFDPQQWAADKHAPIPKYAYFPFGGGPRSCIGESFAWMEGILVLATLAQRWRMRLEPGHPVALLPLVNLRPKYGMRMIVQRRQ